MTYKGLKMNISKCLKNYDIDKSEEFITEVRGQHDWTTGYRFKDDFENERVIMYWSDDKLSHEIKLKNLIEICRLLDKHGFGEYIELKENIPYIELTNFTR